jgi:hypothetical protein
MHLAIKSQISSEYLVIHDHQIVIEYIQIILILNNLIDKTYIMSCGIIHLAFSLAKKMLVIWHSFIELSEIFTEKKWRLFGNVVSVKCRYTMEHSQKHKNIKTYEFFA